VGLWISAIRTVGAMMFKRRDGFALVLFFAACLWLDFGLCAWVSGEICRLKRGAWVWIWRSVRNEDGDV